MLLAEQPWPDVDQPVLLVPVGSCEQHGPHLPLSTDTIIAEHLATEAAQHVTGSAATPPISIGASGEHDGFPGTLSIGTDALTTVLVELIRSADWAAGVVLVNGHGGNLDAIRDAVERSHADGRRTVSAWAPKLPADFPDDLHAGFVETSVMLALRPDLVADEHDEIATPSTFDIDELRQHGVRAVSPSGILGDPTGATPDDGRRLLEAWITDLVAHVERAVLRWAG